MAIKCKITNPSTTTLNTYKIELTTIPHEGNRIQPIPTKRINFYTITRQVCFYLNQGRQGNSAIKTILSQEAECRVIHKVKGQIALMVTVGGEMHTTDEYHQFP